MVEPDGSTMLLLIALKAGTGNMVCLSSWLITKDIMSKNIPDFNGFPTDNSSSTNLKYDIIASKFMIGVENHQKKNNQKLTLPISLGLVSIILQSAIAVIIITAFVVNWIYKKLSERNQTA